MAKETVQDFYRWFKGGQDKNILDYLMDKLNLAGGLQQDIEAYGDKSFRLPKSSVEMYQNLGIVEEDSPKAPKDAPMTVEGATSGFENLEGSVLDFLFRQDKPWYELSEDEIGTSLPFSLAYGLGKEGDSRQRGGQYTLSQTEEDKKRIMADILSLQEGWKELGLENMFSQLDKDVGFEERATKRSTENILQKYIQNKQQGRYAQITGAPRLSNRGLTTDEYLRQITAEKSRGRRSIRDAWGDAGGEMFGEVRDWLEKMT